MAANRIKVKTFYDCVCYSGYETELQEFIDVGADVKGEMGVSALLTALMWDGRECVKILLRLVQTGGEVY